MSPPRSKIFPRNKQQSRSSSLFPSHISKSMFVRAHLRKIFVQNWKLWNFQVQMLLFHDSCKKLLKLNFQQIWAFSELLLHWKLLSSFWDEKTTKNCIIYFRKCAVIEFLKKIWMFFALTHSKFSFQCLQIQKRVWFNWAQALSKRV